MGYNRDNLKKIKEEFHAKRRAALEESEIRTRELENKYPDLKALNLAIRGVGASIIDAALSGKGNVSERMKEIEKEYNDNITFRKTFLETYGYPVDYLDIHYECDKCNDEGYDEDGNMCICMKRALAMATYESSGLGKLLTRQSFDNFSLDYYENGNEKTNMRMIYDACREYAENFTSKTSENMLFFGTTGLGKTHLSTAVAKSVIDRGFDVVYVTAQTLFDDFEEDKFSRNNNNGDLTEKYFGCDLLIVDDLGTELSTQFTVSCLYNIVNARINAEKPMIISTNLDRKELRQRYADRITSRLFGEFSVMCFTGTDIRAKKL